MGMNKRKIKVATLAPDKIAKTASKKPAKLLPLYPGMIDCGKKLKGKNPK